MQHHLNTKSLIYKEALSAISKFEIIKGIYNIQQWDNEHLFCNNLFSGKDGKVLKITEYFEKNKIYTFDQLLQEKVKENSKHPCDAVLVNLFNNISPKSKCSKT